MKFVVQKKNKLDGMLLHISQWPPNHGTWTGTGLGVIWYRIAQKNELTSVKLIWFHLLSESGQFYFEQLPDSLRSIHLWPNSRRDVKALGSVTWHATSRLNSRDSKLASSMRLNKRLLKEEKAQWGDRKGHGVSERKQRLTDHTRSPTINTDIISAVDSYATSSLCWT